MWHSIIILKNVKYNLIRMADIEKVMVYFPKEIANKLKKMAEKNTRSLSGQVVHYVKQGIKMEES